MDKYRQIVFDILIEEKKQRRRFHQEMILQYILKPYLTRIHRKKKGDRNARSSQLLLKNSKQSSWKHPMFKNIGNIFPFQENVAKVHKLVADRSVELSFSERPPYAIFIPWGMFLKKDFLISVP